MREQKDRESDFLKTVSVSDFDLPQEFNSEPADQEILYRWDGGVLSENE